MKIVLLIALTVIFAFQAVKSNRLVTAALWLAGVSVLVSIIFYLLGAVVAAVIELSVGAGLVTVLFVFAIAIAGEELMTMKSSISRLLAGSLVLLLVGTLTWFMLSPSSTAAAVSQEPPVREMLWEGRSLDVLVQIVLIYSGVLGILGLLAEAKAPLLYPVAEQIAALRKQELALLEEHSMEKEN